MDYMARYGRTKKMEWVSMSDKWPPIGEWVMIVIAGAA